MPGPVSLNLLRCFLFRFLSFDVTLSLLFVVLIYLISFWMSIACSSLVYPFLSTVLVPYFRFSVTLFRPALRSTIFSTPQGGTILSTPKGELKSLSIDGME